jgi:hypothetical protein
MVIRICSQQMTLVLEFLHATLRYLTTAEFDGPVIETGSV